MTSGLRSGLAATARTTSANFRFAGQTLKTAERLILPAGILQNKSSKCKQGRRNFPRCYAAASPDLGPILLWSSCSLGGKQRLFPAVIGTREGRALCRKGRAFRSVR